MIPVFIERLGVLLRQNSRTHPAGLHPIHFEVMHYLNLCNRFSNTPQAIGEYLGITKGTLSQSLKVLESKGLVTRQPDAHDRRVWHFELTTTGATLLAEHLQNTFQLLEGFEPAESVQIEQTLNLLLERLVSRQGGKPFGVCKTCKYHQRKEERWCALLNLPLEQDASEKICREHTPAEI
ncbi:MarR family winged helix-turn-helix transcriptional regulator [Deinococcus misasensis]|uniref:MarR family winged helix-turn-helix transcriptional regulator n=1 Tax=Deinococcus misasensis TaxID=392413 RepID=UPI00068DB6FE|nr:MarR family winged helix-turn-helix transcriptional regulator [Deinococcus misasensis]